MANYSRLKPVLSNEKRKRQRYIILMHAADISQRFRPLKPVLTEFNTTYVFRAVTNYFTEFLEMRHMPFHYYVGFNQHDWDVMLGSPATVRSDVLQSAVDCGYLDPIFRDAIVICVQDNFALRIPDSRMYDVVNQKCIIPCLTLLRMGNFIDNVFWYDEVFDIEKYTSDMEMDSLNNKYRYNFRPMKYYRRVDFNLSNREFAK